MGSVQKAVMKAEARRALVSSGMLRSMAAPTQTVSVGELASGEVLIDVHHHVDLALMQEVEGLGLLPFVGRPEDQRGGDAVLCQHVVRAPA